MLCASGEAGEQHEQQEARGDLRPRQHGWADD